MSKVVQRDCCICMNNSARALFRTRLSPGPIVQCLKCGLVYVNPVERPECLSANLNTTEAQVYRQIYLAEAETKCRLYTKALERIESMTGGVGTLLDVGCYLGLFMQTGVARGWQCKGVEPDRDAWQYAVKESGLDVCLGTLSTCGLAPRSFDAATLLQVLEHVLDPRQTLEQVRDLLRPNGVLLMEVPNIDCLSFKILGRRHRHFAKHHFTFFTPETLMTLLTQCGFRPLDVSFPDRMISFRLLGFGLSMWYPRIHRLVAPILNIPPLSSCVLSVNLHEVVSVCAQRS